MSFRPVKAEQVIKATSVLSWEMVEQINKATYEKGKTTIVNVQTQTDPMVENLAANREKSSSGFMDQSKGIQFTTPNKQKQDMKRINMEKARVLQGTNSVQNIARDGASGQKDGPRVFQGNHADQDDLMMFGGSIDAGCQTDIDGDKIAKDIADKNERIDAT